MNVSLKIARRYLFSSGNRNVINIISGIAASGVAVGSLAMIIVLSAFNGLEDLVAEMYTSFDPDIRVTPAKGKTFVPDSAKLIEVASWPEVRHIAPVLEETVFLQYNDQQTVATLRGIESAYLSLLELEPYVIEGALQLDNAGTPMAFMGYGIADNLNLFVSDAFEPIKIYAAKRNAERSINPENKFSVARVLPGAVLAVNPDFDYRFIYTSMDFARNLLDYEGEASQLELELAEGADSKKVKDRLSVLFGESLVVKTRYELNEMLFKTNQTEKWITFFILSFILIVATFNLIGSITMLIIEKKADLRLLRSIGMELREVKRIFLFEGLLITGVGAAIGLGLGVALVLVQQYVGFFPLEGGIVEYYPVTFELLDLLAVAGVVLAIGLLASFIPVRVVLKSARYSLYR